MPVLESNHWSNLHHQTITPTAEQEKHIPGYVEHSNCDFAHDSKQIPNN